MKIDNIFEGCIFSSNKKIEEGDTGVEVSKEDGDALINAGQAKASKEKPKGK